MDKMNRGYKDSSMFSICRRKKQSVVGIEPFKRNNKKKGVVGTGKQ